MGLTFALIYLTIRICIFHSCKMHDIDAVMYLPGKKIKINLLLNRNLCGNFVNVILIINHPPVPVTNKIRIQISQRHVCQQKYFARAQSVKENRFNSNCSCHSFYPFHLMDGEWMYKAMMFARFHVTNVYNLLLFYMQNNKNGKSIAILMHLST